MNCLKSLILSLLAIALLPSPSARADISADRALLVIDDWSQWAVFEGVSPQRKAQLLFLNRGAIVGRLPVLFEGLSVGYQIEAPTRAHQPLTAYHLFNLGGGTTVDNILGIYVGVQAGAEVTLHPDIRGEGLRVALSLNRHGVGLGIAHRLEGFGANVGIDTLKVMPDPEYPEAAALLHERIDWHPESAGRAVDIKNDRQTAFISCYFPKQANGDSQFVSVSAGGLWKRAVAQYSSFTGWFGSHQESADLRLLPSDPAHPRRFVFENVGSAQGAVTVRFSVELEPGPAQPVWEGSKEKQFKGKGSVQFNLKNRPAAISSALECTAKDTLGELPTVLAGP